MKANTKKLLVWLYQSGEANAVLNTKNSDLIWPKMTTSGRRSLIYYLSRQRLIDCISSEDGQLVWLTDLGRRLIEEEYFVLSRFWADWRGDWELVILGKEESRRESDTKTIRDLFTDSGKVMALTRGVYLWPSGSLGGQLEKQLRRFESNWWRVEIKAANFENFRSTVMMRMNLSEINELYSGISREIDQLMAKKETQKRLIYPDIKKIFNILDRLFYVGDQEKGFSVFFRQIADNSFGKSMDFKSLLNSLHLLYGENMV